MAAVRPEEHPREPRTIADLPTVPGLPLVGSAARLRARPLDTMLEVAREHGDMVRLRVLHEDVVLMNDMDAIRHVLVQDTATWSRQYNLEVPRIRAFLGDGPLTSDGHTWRRLRDAGMPAFRHRAVARAAGLVTGVTAEVLEEWAADDPRPQTLFPRMVALTSRIATAAFMSVRVDRHEARELATANLVGQSAVFERLRSPWSLPEPVPTPGNRRFRWAKRALRARLRSIVERRAQSVASPVDLFEIYARARPELTNAELESQLLTMLVAAPENTAATLTWAVYLLGRHPRVERRLLRELDDALGADPVSHEVTAKLPYLACVIKEVMRLYPGAPYLDRRAVRDDTVAGYRLPAGTLAMISPYVLHRSPRHWVEPERFEPERFARAHPKEAFIPFGLGPRRCIGAGFATMVLETVLPMLLRRFEFRTPTMAPVGIAPTINLRPENGMPMIVSHRRAIA